MLEAKPFAKPFLAIASHLDPKQKGAAFKVRLQATTAAIVPSNSMCHFLDLRPSQPTPPMLELVLRSQGLVVLSCLQAVLCMREVQSNSQFLKRKPAVCFKSFVEFSKEDSGFGLKSFFEMFSKNAFLSERDSKQPKKRLRSNLSGLYLSGTISGLRAATLFTDASVAGAANTADLADRESKNSQQKFETKTFEEF